MKVAEPTVGDRAEPTVVSKAPPKALSRAALTLALVLASWLIALVSLAVMLHLVNVTPGYMPDHME